MARKKTSKELFEQCLSETSIHGFRYTVDKQFHLCENVFWTIITLGFILMGSYLVHVNNALTNYVASKILYPILEANHS